MSAAAPEHRKSIYIVSHSSMDLPSVLLLYDRYKDESDVRILISSTAENLQFLRSVSIPDSALRYCRFESKRVPRKSRLAEYLRHLFREKRQLDGLIAEIRSRRDHELYFHSYDNDPHFGYMAAMVSRTNRVTLVDVLGIRPKPLAITDLCTTLALKNLGYLAIMNLVFGRLFFLSGTRSYPMLSLDLKRARIAGEAPPPSSRSAALARYRYRLPENGRIAVLLYADAFGVGEQHHADLHRSLVECLLAKGFEVHVKMHPQSRWPTFLDEYPVSQIPKYVPFELVDLRNVALVIGITGAALLCTETVPTISVLRLVYEPGSDYHRAAMNQLRQNPAIVFISSLEELGMKLETVHSKAGSQLRELRDAVRGSG